MDLVDALVVSIFIICLSLMIFLLAVGLDSPLLQGEPPIKNQHGYFKMTANTNWCEADYIYSQYIAEFWNTLSSLAIVVWGAWGLYFHFRWTETRFFLCYFIFVIVGLGSAGFHGTLSREMQLLDELPMLWGNSVFIYCNFAMADEVGSSRFWTMLILLFCTVSVTLLIIYREESQVFFSIHSLRCYI